MQEREILHCDCNGFYASVECVLNPKLRNVAMAVGGNEPGQRRRLHAHRPFHEDHQSRGFKNRAGGEAVRRLSDLCHVIFIPYGNRSGSAFLTEQFPFFSHFFQGFFTGSSRNAGKLSP